MKKHRILSQIFQDLYRIRYALLILTMYAVPTQILFQTICPFAILTGLPCPACGLTRAGLCLLRGDFVSAWETHPCIFLWVVLILYLVVYRYFLQKKPFLALPLTIFVCIVTLLYFLICYITDTITITIPCNGILSLVLFMIIC